MDKIYLVITSHGSYEDYFEHIQLATNSKEYAEQYAKEINDEHNKEPSLSYDKWNEIDDKLDDMVWNEIEEKKLDGDEDYDRIKESYKDKFHELFGCTYEEYLEGKGKYNYDYYDFNRAFVKEVEYIEKGE